MEVEEQRFTEAFKLFETQVVATMNRFSVPASRNQRAQGTGGASDR